MKFFFIFISLILISSQSFSFEMQSSFEGAVKLHNCSGSLIRFIGQKLSAKAIVLTNGHCVTNSAGFLLRPNEIIYNQNKKVSLLVLNNKNQPIQVYTKKISYATLNNTDIALYELNKTYFDLELLGVNAFILSPDRPETKDDISIISAKKQRIYNCHIDKFIYKLKESIWTFSDSIRYSNSGCETVGGTSGSPLVEIKTKQVVGIHNTANLDKRRCLLGSPCEISEDGEVVVGIKYYGQQTYYIYSCLDDNYQIDLTIDGCRLSK